jgi:anti-anti-sigma regulatory factor
LFVMNEHLPGDRPERDRPGRRARHTLARNGFAHSRFARDGGVPVVQRLADSVPLVRVAGPLTGVAAVQLRHTVHSQLTGDSRLVVLDLRPVVALPLDGVGVLVDIAYDAGASEIGLCLVCGSNLDHPVSAALRSAGVADLFEVHPSLNAALATMVD